MRHEGRAHVSAPAPSPSHRFAGSALGPVAPFLPLLVLLGGLGLAAAQAPGEAPVPPRSEPTATATPLPPVQARRRFVTPTTLATMVAWDRAVVELTTASLRRGATWYVVSNTAGAGVQLRARPVLAD